MTFFNVSDEQGKKLLPVPLSEVRGGQEKQLLDRELESILTLKGGKDQFYAKSKSEG